MLNCCLTAEGDSGRAQRWTIGVPVQLMLPMTHPWASSGNAHLKRLLSNATHAGFLVLVRATACTHGCSLKRLAAGRDA